MRRGCATAGAKHSFLIRLLGWSVDINVPTALERRTPFTALFAPPAQRMEKPILGHARNASASFRRQASVLGLGRLRYVQSLQIRVYCLEQPEISSPKRAMSGKHQKSAPTFSSKPAASRHGPEYCVDIVDGRDKLPSDDAFAIATTEADRGANATL
jgi:hypothetical protein